jgi:hypothetical protein
MDSVILIPLLAASSLFRLQMHFECINFFKKERLKTSFRVQLWLQSIPFLLFDLGNGSSISSIMVVLVKIVTPDAGSLSILRGLAYTTDKCFLIIYW